MLIRRHKGLLCGFAFLPLHGDIIAANVHQVVVRARPCTLRDHGHLERDPHCTFGFGKRDVRINADGTSNDLLVTCRVPVRLHEVYVAHIGQRNALGRCGGAHQNAQALGLGRHALLQPGRKGVRLDPIEDLAHPLLFRAILFTCVESLRRTLVHGGIFTPDPTLVDQALTLKPMGFQDGREDAQPFC